MTTDRDLSKFTYAIHNNVEHRNVPFLLHKSEFAKISDQTNNMPCKSNVFIYLFIFPSNMYRAQLYYLKKVFFSSFFFWKSQFFIFNKIIDINVNITSQIV